MSILAQIVIALAIFTGGLATGIKWHAGQDARAELKARELREADARQQRALGDRKATEHLNTVARLATQLGDAREHIATLSDSQCLDADTVRVLNAIGADGVRAAAGQPAGTPPAAAAGTGLRFSTERDAAGAIAQCRAAYAKVASQLNQILDIEDARHGEGVSRPATAQPLSRGEP